MNGVLITLPAPFDQHELHVNINNAIEGGQNTPVTSAEIRGVQNSSSCGPVNELIDEELEEQNAETNETEAFHILEHGALFTITNAGRNTDHSFEVL